MNLTEAIGYYGIVISSDTYFRRLALSYLEKYGNERSEFSKKDVEKQEDYDNWSNKDLFAEYIQISLSRHSQLGNSINPDNERLKKSNPKQFLLNEFIKFQIFDFTTKLIKNGESVFVGWIITTDNELMELGTAVTEENIQQLQEELNVHNLDGFEIKIYLGPDPLANDTEFRGEKLNKL